MHLADRVARGEDRQLDQLEDLRGAANVRGGVRAQDLGQRLAVAEQLAGAELVLGLADEVLLAGGADQVGVGVAEADVVERVRAAELLVARLDVDRGVGERVVLI